MNVSEALTQLYDIMPEIAGGQFTGVKTIAEQPSQPLQQQQQ